MTSDLSLEAKDPVMRNSEEPKVRLFRRMTGFDYHILSCPIEPRCALGTSNLGEQRVPVAPEPAVAGYLPTCKTCHIQDTPGRYWSTYDMQGRIGRNAGDVSDSCDRPLAQPSDI